MRTNEDNFLLRCNKSANCDGKLHETPINRRASPMPRCECVMVLYEVVGGSAGLQSPSGSVVVFIFMVLNIPGVASPSALF